MQLKVYAIRDQKTEFYNRPFYCHTHGEAERNFKHLVQDQNSVVSKNPEDYDLWYLGTFNDQDGKLDPCPAPEHIINAQNAVSQN